MVWSRQCEDLQRFMLFLQYAMSSNVGVDDMLSNGTGDCCVY